MTTSAAALVVLRKELVDALRDRRTLAVVLLSSVLMGPLVLFALSTLVASLEARAETREVFVDGSAHAPTLVNYLERQTYLVRTPPPDVHARLRSGAFTDPVVVVPVDFEALLARGEVPRIELVGDSANQRASAASARVLRLLEGFGRERARLALALRGVSGELLAPVEVDERDLASAQAQATRLTGILPFFVLMAVLYGALNAALDTTAGERERGSLEPLLAGPASPVAIVLGKWGAVACVAMAIAVLSCVSFLPAQWLLASETLAALFRFGWREALLFLAVLLPFAAAAAALLMAVAIRCRTVKEAQASAAVVVLLASLLPLITTFNPTGEAPWQLWTPALAQSALLMRVLKGESLGALHALPPLAVCAAIVVLSLRYVAGRLKPAAVA
jgi:sodium transport system permease protein